MSPDPELPLTGYYLQPQHIFTAVDHRTSVPLLKTDLKGLSNAVHLIYDTECLNYKNIHFAYVFNIQCVCRHAPN